MPKQKGFESPLKRAQAGEIGAPRQEQTNTETGEHHDAKTFKHQDTKVQQHNDVQTLEHPDTKGAKHQENMKRQTVYMPKELARRLKVHASATDQDISGIITMLVEEYLAKEEAH